jgi:hypothetical protein
MAKKVAKKSAAPQRRRRRAGGTVRSVDSNAETRTPSGILLRTPSGAFSIALDGDDREAWERRVQKAAMRWTYIIRNRERWNDVASSTQEQGQRAHRDLLGLGVPEQALDSIAREGLVEVVIPFESEDVGWEARIFPWEYVIAGATRQRRQGQPLTVVRHLQVDTSVRRAGAPTKVLYVESAPGKLREEFNFDTERELVQAGLRPKKPRDPLVNPTWTQLSEVVGSFKPDVVHVAGFDSHQGLRLVAQQDGDADPPPDNDEAESVRDGYLMRNESGMPQAVEAQRLAQALCAKKHRPTLVAFNLQNSAARIAPHAVVAGAAAAIGFQDTFDDHLGERFFGTFYRIWRQEKWDLLEAFRRAWESIRTSSTSIRGSGLVLWSRQPLVQVVSERMARQRRVAREARKPTEPATLWTPDAVASDKARSFIKHDVKVLEEINYSLLHNREPLFDSFSLVNLSANYDRHERLGTIAGIDVSVKLSTGLETAVYQSQITLSQASDDLARRIHVPLTSDLMRSAHEAINSSLFVEVCWGSHVLYRDSHLVRLLPVDQWRDNDRDGQWLPSFVLPRDPAVGTLIDKAQRYVRVLRDDPSAGFDGYQSVDKRAADPWIDVDRQVQAIWSMIVHDLGLGYVNPPPGYSNELDSQRLRTPTMVVKDRSGTCLDLALLFAACLELIDIYPVIFLLNGHAFPGYWRSDELHEEFNKMSGDFADDLHTEDKEKTKVAGAQRAKWWPRRAAYDEIKRRVRLGHLVPIETVWLTEHSGFWDAVDGGRDNLKSKREFHSMLDIVRARQSGVTPLPIGDGQ